ncbi:hypothetical protein BaRGS_00028553, partial [Batillaria attramentaria]
ELSYSHAFLRSYLKAYLAASFIRVLSTTSDLSGNRHGTAWGDASKDMLNPNHIMFVHRRTPDTKLYKRDFPTPLTSTLVGFRLHKACWYSTNSNTSAREKKGAIDWLFFCGVVYAVQQKRPLAE